MTPRPTYETAADLSRERHVIARAAEAWGAAPRKLPKSYGLDFAFVRGRVVVAWAEVKVRTYSASAFPTYMLSLHKWTRGREWSRATRVPFILVVRFTDAILYTVTDDSPPAVQFAGRADRGDWQDAEPCVMLPMTNFRRLQHDHGKQA